MQSLDPLCGTPDERKRRRRPRAPFHTEKLLREITWVRYSSPTLAKLFREDGPR